MNDAMLRAKMVLHGDSSADLAEYLGISRQTISAKINETNGAEFTQQEIRKIINRYGLTESETCEIFFA